MGIMPKVLWEELFPYEFKERLIERPVVYLPIGLCEPHGQISALGMDLLKVKFVCEQTALQKGGIVAPSVGYHIQESGSSAKWLEEQVGETNACMTSIPPYVFFKSLLYQLRAFYNSGFQTAILLSGHGGPHRMDLKRLVSIFMEYVQMNVWYGADQHELLEGSPYRGDHAGKNEISALMYIRPELVNPSLLSLENVPDSGGILALKPSAKEASWAYGKESVNYAISSLGQLVEGLQTRNSGSETWNRTPLLTYEQIEQIWDRIQKEHWESMQPQPDKEAVSETSRWKSSERSKFY
jgi:creatinine amidohydrolase